MSKENTNNKNMESTTRPRKAVFMMRAEGQSWEDFKKACIDSFWKKGMLTEPEKNLSDKEQLNVHKNGGGIGQQGIEKETDE